MALLLVEAVDSAAVVVSVVAAVLAAVNHPHLMEHRQVEAADHRPRTVHLPVVVVEVLAVVVSEEGHPPRAMERHPPRAMEHLLRPTVRPRRAMGHRAAVAAVEVDILEVEANPRLLTELPVPVAAAVLEEVDTLVVVEYLQLTVHPREVVVDTLVVAAEDTLAVVADIPVVAAEDTLVVVAADIPAVAVSEGKI